MPNSVKALLPAALLAMTLAGAFISYTWQHWWVYVGTAKVISADDFKAPVWVYKSASGEFLFLIGGASWDIYVFYPQENLIGIPNSSQFYFIPYAAYCRDIPVPVVYSDDKVKVEKDMNIVVENQELQFTTFSGLRVKSDLRGL